MSPLIRLSILLVMTLAPAVSALADPVYPPNPQYANFKLDPIYPYRGTYYDPTQSGTGIQVDVGASGNAFVTYYSYTATGQPDWYILQGTYQPSDEVTRWTTGVIGTLSGTFYQAFNGQCLGCPYTPTGGAALTNYNATLTWTNSREVKMTVGDQHWDFIAPNLDGKDDGDYLVGTWAASIALAQDGKYPHKWVTSGDIELAPAPYPVVVAPGSSALTNMPPGAKTYIITSQARNNPSSYNTFLFGFLACMNRCIDHSYNDTPSQAIFWYDQPSNRFGIDSAHPQTDQQGQTTKYVIGPNNAHYDLHLVAPNHIVGRGVYEGTLYTDGNFIPGGSEFRISLVKLPAPAVGP